jgi:hypothetical protein
MNWHDYLALTIFAVAAVVVITRAYRAFFAHAKPGCGSGCGSCGSAASVETSRKLVAIEPSSAESPRR